MKKLISIVLVSVALFGAPRVGDKAVEFNLPSLYDQTRFVKSKSLHGRVILLNLWASWCSGCQEEMPLFVKLQKEYPKKKFEIVLSSIDNEMQGALDFLAEVDKEKILTSLYDGDKKLPKTYRCPGMPSSFLIDKDGKIVKVYVGSLDEQAMKELKEKIKVLLGS